MHFQSTTDIPTHSKQDVWVEDFGLADYSIIWERQKQRVQERLEGKIGNGILIGEHYPVITLGRGSHMKNLFNPTIPVISVERGGDVTYHGPGQLVAYPIILLEEGQRDLHRYLRTLEQSVIDTMAHFGVKGIRNPGLTGVWVETNSKGKTELKKVCSIGVAVKRWVTYHGLSLNINCDLLAYQQINPCGLDKAVMGNLSSFTQNVIPLNIAKNKLLHCLCHYMECIKGPINSYFQQKTPYLK